jgi:hypothetical protein
MAPVTAGRVRRARWASVALASALAVAVFAAPVGAQSRSVRFEVDSAADSTFIFPLGRASWVKPRATGIVVDPRQRDVLVARFQVLAVRDGRAVGLVTGQTTDVARGHVALLEEPRDPWYKRADVWTALFVGIATGIGAGAAIY